MRSIGDIAGDLGWLPNTYAIAMTLSVLKCRFPTGSLRTVSTAFCCSAEMSTH